MWVGRAREKAGRVRRAGAGDGRARGWADGKYIALDDRSEPREKKKTGQTIRLTCKEFVVGDAGFEPATPSV